MQSNPITVARIDEYWIINLGPCTVGVRHAGSLTTGTSSLSSNEKTIDALCEEITRLNNIIEAKHPNIPAVLSVLADALCLVGATTLVRYNAVLFALRHGIVDADPQGLPALSLHMARTALGIGSGDQMTDAAIAVAVRAMGR